MRFKLILFLIISFCLFYGFSATHAQKAGKGNRAADSTRAAQKSYQDSLKAARQQALDSIKTARQHTLDSTKEARQTALDSVKNIRKHSADSLASIHKYRDSKHYKDSVAHARTDKANAIKEQRQAGMDSIKAIRKKTADSVIAARKATMDNLHNVQKHRSDSLALIRKYKTSKRYRDSVSIVRHERMDSLKEARAAFNDSVLTVRKQHQDSVSTIRKHVMDSTKVVRTKYMDSVKAIRKVRTDSLAKAKLVREKAEKARLKQREDKQKLAIDLKIKSKREKWSNETMLKKKWTPVRQVEQNTFTRFNYYFNADRKMDEALVNMQRVHKENYDSVIGLYPFDPNRDSSLLSADMDSIIRKASVGIQIHDPRTKWGNDMYLLMGEAYYYKGSYDNAAITFRYIISRDEQAAKKKAAAEGHSSKKATDPSIVQEDKKTMLDFLKHQSVHNDAILWLSRTYTESNQVENAEAILSLLDSDPKVPEDLKGQIAVAKAFVALNDHNYKDASNQLSIAVKDKNVPEITRQRASFLNGQLLQRQGSYAVAAANFKQALDLNPKLDMDFYSRKYLAYNTVMAGGNTDEAMRPMKKILNDAKYAAYYEQIYYVLGQIAAQGNDNEMAVTYLRKGLSTPKSTKKQKGYTYAALGNVYYQTGNYVGAKNAYDSASLLAGGAPGDSVMNVAVLRSKVLGEVTEPLSVIHNQDSLLQLAALSDKEQRANARKYIRYLQQRRDDSVTAAENAGVNAVIAASQDNEDGQVGNWYFSNANLMQQGYTDFKRKWGNRPLVDNWRRVSGINVAAVNNTTDSVTLALTDEKGKTGKDNGLDENGFPTEASLLAAIPRTPERQERSRKVIQDAYMSLSNAYIKDLEDYPPGIRTLDTLDARYPNHARKPEDLYLRYLVAMRQQHMDVAQGYSQQLLTGYPASDYAALVRPKEDAPALITANTSVPVADYYDETYSLLMQHQYTDVLIKLREAKHLYNDSRYTKRFNIMEAIAYAGSGNYNQADTILTAFLHTNPSDSLKAWADAVLAYINKNRPAASPAPAMPAVNKPAALPAPALIPAGTKSANTDNKPLNPNNKVAAAQPAASTISGNPPASPVSPPASPVSPPASAASGNNPSVFTYKPQEDHYCIIVVPGVEARAMGVKAAIADYNTFNYSAQKLGLAIDPLTTSQAIIVIKKFPNAAAAKSYMSTVKGTGQIFREYNSSEYRLLVISANNYLKVLSDKSLQAYFSFYSSNYK